MTDEEKEQLKQQILHEEAVERGRKGGRNRWKRIDPNSPEGRAQLEPMFEARRKKGKKEDT